MPGPPTVAEQTRPEQSAPDPRRAGFVLGLDVGSSVIRCHVYDRAARIRGSSAQKVTEELASGQRVWVARGTRDRVAGGARGRDLLMRLGRSHLQHRGPSDLSGALGPAKSPHSLPGQG